MRIAVMGAGSIGGYFGGMLSLGGNEVTLIARGAHLEAIRAGDSKSLPTMASLPSNVMPPTILDRPDQLTWSCSR